MFWIIFVVVVVLFIGFFLSQLFYPIAGRPHSGVTTTKGAATPTAASTTAASPTQERSLLWWVTWIAIGIWVAYSVYEYYFQSGSGGKGPGVSWFNPIPKISALYSRTVHPYMVDFDTWDRWQVELHKYGDLSDRRWIFTVEPKRSWMETTTKLDFGSNIDEIVIKDAVSEPLRQNYRFSLEGTCRKRALTKECSGTWKFVDNSTGGEIGSGDFQMQVDREGKKISGFLGDDQGYKEYEIVIEQ